MTDAPLYRCSGCGAPAAEGSRECGYCRAPLASVRCARCFHANVEQARHCSGCGEELGLEPLSRLGTLSCAACKVTLRNLDGGGAEVFDCERCGGQFVEHRALRALLERREALGKLVPIASAGGAAQNPLRQKVVYRPCPNCQQLMNRKNFGGQSGIVVDVCTRHGTWFDAGELPGVLTFVEKGGLERAARTATPRAVSAAGVASAPLVMQPWNELSIAADLTGIAGELLGYVIDVLATIND